MAGAKLRDPVPARLPGEEAEPDDPVEIEHRRIAVDRVRGYALTFDRRPAGSTA